MDSLYYSSSSLPRRSLDQRPQNQLVQRSGTAPNEADTSVPILQKLVKTNSHNSSEAGISLQHVYESNSHEYASPSAPLATTTSLPGSSSFSVDTHQSGIKAHATVGGLPGDALYFIILGGLMVFGCAGFFVYRKCRVRSTLRSESIPYTLPTNTRTLFHPNNPVVMATAPVGSTIRPFDVAWRRPQGTYRYSHDRRPRLGLLRLSTVSEMDISPGVNSVDTFWAPSVRRDTPAAQTPSSPVSMRSRVSSLLGRSSQYSTPTSPSYSQSPPPPPPLRKKVAFASKLDFIRPKRNSTASADSSDTLASSYKESSTISTSSSQSSFTRKTRPHPLSSFKSKSRASHESLKSDSNSRRFSLTGFFTPSPHHQRTSSSSSNFASKILHKAKSTSDMAVIKRSSFVQLDDETVSPFTCFSRCQKDLVHSELLQTSQRRVFSS